MPVVWREDHADLGGWEDRSDAVALVGHDYGGTFARTGIYLRSSEGRWQRVRVGSVRHEGQRELIDAGVAEAWRWIRERLGSSAVVRLGLGCKGPTDTRTGWTDPGTHFAWGRHNVVAYFHERHPGAFAEIVAANDLVTGALGAALSPEVQAQIAAFLDAWNAAHPDDPIPTDRLQTDLAVLSLGTGAGYKVIDAEGRVGQGGEVWTLYAPIDPAFFLWLWERHQREKARPDGDPTRYAPYTERFVSSGGLPLVLEYLQARGENPSDALKEALAETGDLPQAISLAARAGCPLCRKVMLYLAVHVASLAQGIVQAHKPRALVLSGASLLVPNWELLEEPFFRYFRREFAGRPVEFPLVAESRIGLRSWIARTPVALDRSPLPGVDGAAYLAAHAEFFRQSPQTRDKGIGRSPSSR